MEEFLGLYTEANVGNPDIAGIFNTKIPIQLDYSPAWRLGGIFEHFTSIYRAD